MSKSANYRNHVPRWVNGILLVLAAAGVACQESRAEEPPEQPAVRELFVPYPDLEVLLKNQPRRVLLPRKEFDELMAKARKAPADGAPAQAILTSASYSGAVDAGQARIVGTMTVTALNGDLLAVPLDFSGVGILRADLDGAAAPLGEANDHQLTLFVHGKGEHRLTVEVLAPLKTTAARQVLSLQLPVPGGTRLRLTMPGEVEVKSGAAVISRTSDAAAGVTRLELLPQRGPVELQMTLNNRMLKQDRVVAAHTVMVDEVTAAYERIHATIWFDILHGSVTSFRFALPDGFDVTAVSGQQMASWNIVREGKRSLLEVKLHDATTEAVSLSLTAERDRPPLDQWTLPHIEPLDVVRHDAVAGLLLENHFEVEQLSPQGMITLDTQSLAAGLPAGGPDTQRLRTVSAWYAPLSDYTLTARFRRPPAQLNVTTNLLLVLADKGEEMRGQFVLQPTEDKLFACDFTAPKDWTVDSVTSSNNAPLRYETSTEPNGLQRIHVRLPQGVPPNSSFPITFRATLVPVGWLESWQSREVPFPVFQVSGATRDQGTLAIEGLDDLAAEPANLKGLVPLYNEDKVRYGIENRDVQLAFSYGQQPYSGALSLKRRPSWVTTRSYQFARVTSDALFMHSELQYSIQDARTSAIAFSLPESTPLALSIQGLGGTSIKEYRSEKQGDRRRWIVELSQRTGGEARIAVDFQQHLPDAERSEVTLPLTAAEKVAYESGIVAVEGSPQLDVQIAEGHPREVDVGELIEAQYRPGPRLLGAYAFVGEGAKVTLKIARNKDYALPSSLVERAELITAIGNNGVSQTMALFRLRTKARYLEIVTPPDSTLWSVVLDDTPARPLGDAHGVFVPLPAASNEQVRELRVAYQTPVSPLALSGRVKLKAPELRLRGKLDGPASDVPMADVQWRLHLPEGYAVVASDGTVQTNELAKVQLPLNQVAALLYVLGGGARGFVTTRSKSANLAPISSPALAPHDGREAVNPPEIDVYGAGAKGDDGNKVYRAIPKPATPPAASAPPPPSAAAPAPAPPVEPPPVPEKQPAGTTSGGGGPTAGGKPTDGYYLADDVSYFRMSGHSSLKIALETAGPATTFRSLGVDPVLAVRVVDSRRIGFGALGIALLVALIGVMLTRRSARTRARYVVSVLLLSLVLPLIIPRLVMYAPVFNGMFLAGALLVLYYLAVGVVRWLIRLGHRPPRVSPKPVVVSLILLVAAISQVATISPARAASPSEKGEEADVHHVVVLPPVKVPDDVILVPYDPNNVAGIEAAMQRADRLLVPLKRYTELWNRVHPDEKLQPVNVPADYAIAGAEFEGTATDGESLDLMGHIDLHIFSDRPVEIPFALSGIVLARADIGGKPARLRIVQSQPPQEQQQKVAQKDVASPEMMMAVLEVQGKGQKRVDLAIRVPLTKSGGWRIARGAIPSAPAAVLKLHVPKRGTEVCSVCSTFSEKRETAKDDEVREINIPMGELLDLRWRGHVDEAIADPTLTVESNILVDVREDAWRTTWQVAMQFSRQQRESFQLLVPGDYLVEKVVGTNVRGFDVAKLGDRQRIEVRLLAPATGSETLTVFMARPPAAAGEGAARFVLPAVDVTGANLHRGKYIIRRSPLLDVRAVSVTGLQQTSIPDNVAALSAGNPGSPLPLRPLAAYSFNSSAAVGELSVESQAIDLSGTVQTDLWLQSPDVQLESHIIYQAPNRPVHRLQIALPPGMTVDRLEAPTNPIWSVARVKDRDILSIYFATGQQKTFDLLLWGRLKNVIVKDKLALPHLELLGVSRQQGEVVVKSEPGYDVRARNLVGAEPLLLEAVYSWLKPEQRDSARLALRYQKADYSGELSLEARAPHVRATTVTNVRYTPTAIEETVHLKFVVTNAGIHELSFLLPEGLRQARIAFAPLLRQKSIEPAADRPGWVRVRLQFQDRLLGDVNIGVTHDQLLTSEAHPAPIPIVETGETTYRYVVLENAGRDEVVVAKREGVESLSHQQNAMQELIALLGNDISEAYVVQEGAANPLLSLRTTRRELERTAGARIRLAETRVVVDANGAYRADQVLYMHNSTEQFLSIQLPKESRLWTVRVAGVPVKPVSDGAAATSFQFLIPLVRTQEGDLDYQVDIKFGGMLPTFALGQQVSFPLPQTINIKTEQSQVQLWLPETQNWFDFHGATPVTGPEELEEGHQQYQADQTKRLTEALSSKNPFAQARARSNVVQLRSEYDRQLAENSNNSRLLRTQGELLQKAQQQVELAKSEQNITNNGTDAQDHRGKLAQKWNDAGILNGALNESGQRSNWGYSPGDSPGKIAQGHSTGHNTTVDAVTGSGGLTVNGNDTGITGSLVPAQESAYGFNGGWYNGNKVDVNQGTLVLGQATRGDRQTLQVKEGTPQRQSGQRDARVGEMHKLSEMNKPVSQAQPEPSQTANQETFSGKDFYQGQTITGAGTLQKIGTGTQTFSGNNTYSGTISGSIQNQSRAADQQQLAQRYEQELSKKSDAVINQGGGQAGGGQYPGGGQYQWQINAPNGLSGAGGVAQAGQQLGNGTFTVDAPQATISAGTLRLGSGAVVPGGQIKPNVVIPNSSNLVIDGAANVAQAGEDQNGRFAAARMGQARGPAKPAPNALPASLVSLDVAIPTRGKPYYFTAVRGDMEITARAVPSDLVRRLSLLAGILVAMVIVYLVCRAVRLRSTSRPFVSTLMLLLIFLGLLSLVTMVLPIYGLLAIGVAIAAFIRMSMARA